MSATALAQSNTLFVKEDWILFRSLGTLGQKAGVPESEIPKLVAKELVDNALDEAGSCRIELIDGNGFRVSDCGAGIPGDDAEVASLFSINRPLTSSKLLRRPTRGALGNGLRVVTGAVVATQGTILVSTRGRTLRLSHDHDTGDTLAENLGAWDQKGTQIQVTFGGRFSIDQSALEWAEMAILLAGRESYTGKTSPHWYDPHTFHELLQAARGKGLRELVASFEGYAGPKAGRLIQSQGYNGELCRELSKEQATALLRVLRKGVVNPVSTKKLGEIGPIPGFANHAKFEGTVSIGSSGYNEVEIPVVVEAWTRESDDFSVSAFVNRTPITGDIEILKSVDKAVVIRGCGCFEFFGGNHKPFDLWFNVDTPYMPIVTDGKEPNFRPFGDLIKAATQKAAKRIPREKDRPRDKGLSQKAAIFQLIPDCAKVASSDGKHRFQQRALFYKIRTPFMEYFGYAPEYGYFCQVITEYENEYEDIPGMIRDPRGVIYHPHTHQEIPLGTLFVEAYTRPEWLFNKVLYIEKEGLFSILKHEHWPENHDCALMTSKGQGTRAAKDLIDLLGRTEEACEFFIIHDADAAGTMIYQCLQEETAARGARNVKILNLGLEPHEGREMGLDVEQVTYKKIQAVADYVPYADDQWLQKNRIELDAMIPAEFLEWLNAKFAAYTKLIPPLNVMRDKLEEDVREKLEAKITDEVLEEAGIDELVDEAFEELKPSIGDHAENLVHDVEEALDHDGFQAWRSPVGDIATEIVSKVRGDVENDTRS